MPDAPAIFRVDEGRLSLAVPWGGAVSLAMPSFLGESGGGSFLVRQRLRWDLDADADGRPRARFELEGANPEVGIRFAGQVVAAAPDEYHLDLTLTNDAAQPLARGRHAIFLGLGDLEGFADVDGRNTVFHTDHGWRPRHLLTRRGVTPPPSATVRVGTLYDGVTVIWDLIVRLAASRDRLAAFGIDRSPSFSSDHPDWGCGLLAACRWGTLDPGESQAAHGAIYLLESSFADLEVRYHRHRRR